MVKVWKERTVRPIDPDKLNGPGVVCCDIMEFLQRLPNDSVDMAFGDPPYFLSTEGGTTCSGGKRKSVKKGDWDVPFTLDKEKLKELLAGKVSSADEYLQLLDIESRSGDVRSKLLQHQWYMSWMGELRRVLKPCGTLWLSGTQHCIFSMGWAAQVMGWGVLNSIWSDTPRYEKTNPPPNLGCRRYTDSFEHLLWLLNDPIEGKTTFTFNYDTVKKKYGGGKQVKTIWKMNRPGVAELRYGSYPAQKPEGLLERIIIASTKKDDLVIDPFMGSGTTGVAAIRWGRRFIGCDLSEDGVAITKKRLYDVQREHEVVVRCKVAE